MRRERRTQVPTAKEQSLIAAGTSKLQTGFACAQEVQLPPLGGAGGARYYQVLMVGKKASGEYPWASANDRVASQIGRLLGLPVPDSVLYRVGDEWVFFSHYIGEPPVPVGDTPVPSHGDRLSATLQADAAAHLRHGTIVFDIFVANNDRKADNIVLGVDGRAYLIDQANALFYRPYSYNGTRCAGGIERLAAVERDLHHMFDKEHHFLKWLRDWDLVTEWCDRIAGLPEWRLESTVYGLPEGLLSDTEKEAAVAFLAKRRCLLYGIIEEHRSEFFPNLAERL